MIKEDRSRSPELQGWQEIAEFLGLPVATAQRWEKSGMPVHRGGRYVYALPEELNRWVAKSRPPALLSTLRPKARISPPISPPISSVLFLKLGIDESPRGKLPS